MTDDADWHDRYCDTGKHPKPASEDRQRSVTAFIVPALLSTGAELNRVIDRIAGDDAITDVSVKLSSSAVAGTTSFVEWEMCGRFTRPAFLDDDLMIEPTWQAVTPRMRWPIR